MQRRKLFGLAASLGTLSGALMASTKPAQAVTPAAAAGIKFTVLFGQPTDAAAFERHYLSVHLPLLRAVAGIRRIELARPLPQEKGVLPSHHRITELWFDSLEQMTAVTHSADWRQVLDDVPKFASGGVTVLVSQLD